LKSDPKATIFVGRLSLKTDEGTLERQFDRFGDIRRIHLIFDKITKKPKGYAFIEFRDPRSVD